MTNELPVQFSDVQSAAEHLSGVAHRTPLLTSRSLDQLAGARLFFKCENFQRVGAFKFRGAYNALSRLSDEQRRRGVLTYSSGNHAQAVALAGRLLGIETTIIMPSDAPRVKVEATRGYGGQVVLYERDETTREALAQRMVEQRGATIIPPYDHRHVIAGQGTTARELIEQVREIAEHVLSGAGLRARRQAGTPAPLDEGTPAPLASGAGLRARRQAGTPAPLDEGTPAPLASGAGLRARMQTETPALLDEAAPALLDAVYIPVGGGGLISGCAIAIRGMLGRSCRIIGVEPAAADDAARSFRTGELHTVHNPATIADGARTPSLGRLTFAIVRELVDDIITVPDAALIDAMRLTWERMKIVVEPTGVLGLAGALSQCREPAGAGTDPRKQRIGVILTGGNVDAATAAALLSTKPPGASQAKG
jgi:threonine dehydratase